MTEETEFEDIVTYYHREYGQRAGEQMTEHLRRMVSQQDADSLKLFGAHLIAMSQTVLMVIKELEKSQNLVRSN